MVFDALKSVEELREAGVPEAHAKAQIRILQGVIESDLATKRDLKELELRLTIKLGSIVVVVIGLLVALSRLKFL